MSNTLDQISKEIDRISREIADEINPMRNPPTFDEVLEIAMRKWCEVLEFDQATTEEIISWRKNEKINPLISHIYQDGHENKNWSIFDNLRFIFFKILHIPNPFDLEYPHLLYQAIETICSPIDLAKTILIPFYQNNQRRKNMNIMLIVVIAFLIVAVGYLSYLLLNSQQNKQENQTNSRQDNDQFNATRSQAQTPVTTVQPQPITVEKQFLVLVAPVSKKGSLESLRGKSKLDADDAGLLYEMTQYLWVGAESDYRAKMTQVAQSDMPSTEQSEYNYYLVGIELKEGASNRYEGFKPGVDSLKRSDAFRELVGSDINLEISARLKSQEALSTYGNFKLYNR